jgi:hypothetical protein
MGAAVIHWHWRADWVGAWGQWAGALGTVAAVVVALWLAGRDTRLQRKREEATALAQARLVRISGPGGQVDRGKDGDQFQHTLNVAIANHGSLPILEMRAEVWGAGQSLREAAAFGCSEDVILAGQRREFPVGVTSLTGNFNMAAWRVRWKDPMTGGEWFVDGNGREPGRFKGQPPRPH